MALSTAERIAPGIPEGTPGDIYTSIIGSQLPVVKASSLFFPQLTRISKADEIEVPVQINGKVRGKITVSADVDEAALKAAALAEPRIQELLAGKQIKKAIIVPKKLVNLVVG